MQLEGVDTCPVCGNLQFSHLVTATDFTVTHEAFNIVKCSHCGLAITNPRPTSSSIDRYYRSANYISHTGGSKGMVDRIYRAVRTYSIKKKLKLISTHIPKGKLLDYGCGTGEFLQAAKTEGWQCTGVEPSAEARQKIQTGIQVYPQLSDYTGEFDAITLWHVLEHVHDLDHTVSSLKQRLRTGGIIFIAVPNHESHDAQHYGSYWAGYDVPRHLWHFTKGSLKSLLSKHGFKLLDIQPMKFDAFYVSLLSESYKSPHSRIAGAINAFTTGVRSNQKALTDNYSSLIYIARS